MTNILDRPTYSDLLQEEPRPIRNEEDAAKVYHRIDELVEKGQLSEAEEEYLALLGALVLAWEDGRYAPPELTVLEVLHALLEDNQLRQVDLVGPVFATPSIASEVLAGKRQLTYDHVTRLAEFFHVSPALFYPQGTA